jgi:hypothetical protein
VISRWVDHVVLATGMTRAQVYDTLFCAFNVRVIRELPRDCYPAVIRRLARYLLKPASVPCPLCQRWRVKSAYTRWWLWGFIASSFLVIGIGLGFIWHGL